MTVVVLYVEWKDVGLSALRWLLGLSIGSVLGLLLALLTQSRVVARGTANYVVDFLRAIPIIGLVPVVQMQIGINEYGKIGLIAWAVLFVIWISVTASVKKEMPSCELMLSAAGIVGIQRQRVYVIPKVLEGFINGVELAIGTGWLCVVASEWIGTYTKGFWAGGLGYRLMSGYEQGSWPIVYQQLLCFGVLGFVTTWLWRGLIRWGALGGRSFRPVQRVVHG